MILHVLRNGFPLCRFTNELPGRWPLDHRWTSWPAEREATCEGCQDALQKEAQAVAPPPTLPEKKTVWDHIRENSDEDDSS